MNVSGRILVASGLIVAAQVAVLAIRGTEPERSAIPSIGPQSLPESIGDFRGHDEPLDPRIVAHSNADAVLNRAYTNRLGDKVIVNVSIWVNYKRGIPHPPDLCYPMAGWEIVNRRSATVPAESGDAVRVKRYLFQRDASRAAVVMWVHFGDDNVVHSDELRPIFQRLRRTGGKLPPLVKVMLHTDAVDSALAHARLTRFVSELVPYTAAIR